MTEKGGSYKPKMLPMTKKKGGRRTQHTPEKDPKTKLIQELKSENNRLKKQLAHARKELDKLNAAVDGLTTAHEDHRIEEVVVVRESATKATVLVCEAGCDGRVEKMPIGPKTFLVCHGCKWRKIFQ
jgi:predicted RNase H-like nuclease (RuvC/YqgF family)